MAVELKSNTLRYVKLVKKLEEIDVRDLFLDNNKMRSLGHSIAWLIRPI